ncbi:MAG: alpha/beta hydrolase-fold protein [Bdellovibrionota bacterium]
MIRFILVSIALILGSSNFAFAEKKINPSCYKIHTPVTASYCIYRADENPSDDILYYFHGLGGNETSWGDKFYYTEQIRQQWKSEGKKIPTVVTISFGQIWLLASKNSSPYSGLLDFVAGALIPGIESQLGGFKGKRILMGESMGGFNSIQMALKTSMFERTAIICAPMAQLSPWATPEEIKAYTEGTVAWAYYTATNNQAAVTQSIERMITLSRQFYPTPAEWATGNPLVLAASPKSRPDLYITVGFYDNYASYEATGKFVEILRANGANVEWRPQWGGHCVVDIPSVAKFLVP